MLQNLLTNMKGRDTDFCNILFTHQDYKVNVDTFSYRLSPLSGLL